MCIQFRSLVLSLGLLALVVPSNAQDNSDRINKIKTNLNNAKQAYEQLPDHVKKTAHAQRRLANLSDAVNLMAPRLSKMSPGQPWSDDRNQNDIADENGVVRVNNPARDFRFSPFVGYTQNETAIARCGDSVVVGFNDSGSVLETLANGTAGISFSGVAASHDGGASFRDLGFMPPGGSGTNIFNADILLGDPSVACSDSSNFYYVQNYFPFDPSLGGFGELLPSIGISTSHDGGRTWSDPSIVISAPTFADLFGDPQVAVDPSNPKRVYVAYLHDNFTDPMCGILSNIEVETSI